jgi:invasion protein IalB
MFDNNIAPAPAMTSRTASRLLAALLAALLVAGALWSLPNSGARAQSIERIGDFSDWSAFKYEEGGKPICFMASEPTKAEGNYTTRGKIHAMVTQRPGDNRIDEVSIQAGYDYKEKSLVDVQVGTTKLRLFTEGGSAWAVDKDADKTLVQAMIKGNTMVVQGTSSRGTNTKDTYSLSGFTRAYEAIRQACGLK